MVFSNVPGPVTPYIITGRKAKKMMFFVGGTGTLSGGITILSCYETIKVSYANDEANVKDPRKLVDQFNSNVDALLNKVKDDWIKRIN